MTKEKKVDKWQKYNRLTVIEEVEKKNYHRYFKCICDCENIKIIRLDSLIHWATKSCWCAYKEGNTTHWMVNTRIYKIWDHIKTRCNNKKCKEYKYYWGRGITHDSKWETFEWFYEDMKDWYNDFLTIDRKENNKWYSKENCRWVTMKIQWRNKRNNLIYKGKCISEWIEELGLNKSTVSTRIYQLWWSIEESLEIIIRGWKTKKTYLNY